MRVLHIIPAAFNYFDDIKERAFTLVNSLSEYGIEADAITLQYGNVTKKEKAEVQVTAPETNFLGQESVKQNMEKWQDYDLLNIHCPLFGAGKDIVNWRKEFPNIPIVSTYHHDFITTDLFSWFVKYISNYYTKRAFALSDVVTFFADNRALCERGLRFVKNEEKVVVLGWREDLKDIHSYDVVEDLIMVYNYYG